MSEKGTQPRGRPEKGEDISEQFTILSPACVKTFSRDVWSLVCFLKQTKRDSVPTRIPVSGGSHSVLWVRCSHGCWNLDTSGRELSEQEIRVSCANPLRILLTPDVHLPLSVTFFSQPRLQGTILCPPPLTYTPLTQVQSRFYPTVFWS